MFWNWSYFSQEFSAANNCFITFFIMILLDAKFIDCFENHLFDNLDLKNMASYDYLRG